MNKKLIVTAMGLVLAGAMGVANADVKLYGQLDLSIDRDDPANVNPVTCNNPGVSCDDDLNMSSNNSAIGVKGSEDLGNGMSAFFKVEYQTNVNDSNDDGWRGRDQYVGLKFERFGKLTLGTMSTAYKSPGSKIDVAYRTSLQSRGLGLQSALHAGKGENGQGRTPNTIRYDSPSWAGFSLMGTYNLDSDQNDANDDDTYSIGAQYKGGNFYAAASYIDTQADPSDTSAAQFLAKYTWNDLSFHGIYEMDGGLITATRSTAAGLNDIPGGAEDDGADVWSVGATYTIGNNVLFADFGQGSDSDGIDGVNGTGDDVDEYDSWRLGALHRMSQRTFLYAGYGSIDADNSDDITRYTLGVRHNF